MRQKSLLACLFLLISIFWGFGQSIAKGNKKAQKRFHQAHDLFQAGKNDEAIFQLEKAIALDSSFAMAHFALADIFHENGNRKEEIAHLYRGLEVEPEAYPKGYFFLAEALYKTALYGEALIQIETYFEKAPHLDQKARQLLAACQFAEQAIKNPVDFELQNMGEAINGKGDEYWPSLGVDGDELIFTRLRTPQSGGEEMGQEDFFVAKKDSSGWERAVPIGTPVNTGHNEGAQCISADGRLLFFTACNRPDGLGSCDIYLAVRIDGQWSVPVNLGSPVNTGAWESQPSISADGRFLYFASNRRGGKGNKDIWRAQRIGITSDGLPVFSNAENLSAINTQGNESAPFIHPDGVSLYFSSDFYPGMGGTDLFVSRKAEEQFEEPHNIGYPINTHADESGLFVTVDGKRAFFNSEREGFGGRDIFSFKLPEAVRPEPVGFMRGIIRNATTDEPLASQITIQELVRGDTIQTIYPEENEGNFLACFPAGKNYGVHINCPGFLFASANVNLSRHSSEEVPQEVIFGLVPIKVGEYTVLNNVFFETDEAVLRHESFVELDEVVRFMKMNPTIVIEIGGHTDNVGGAEYNQNLSELRAKAVVDYLIEKGVSRHRISSKGYGFTQPIRSNESEEGRAVNRRTSFTIMKK